MRFAQGEGYLQVADNHALVLVEEATRAGGWTSPTSRTSCVAAQDAYDQAEDDSEEKRAAARDRRRYEAWLEVAEGS